MSSLLRVLIMVFLVFALILLSFEYGWLGFTAGVILLLVAAFTEVKKQDKKPEPDKAFSLSRVLMVVLIIVMAVPALILLSSAFGGVGFYAGLIVGLLFLLRALFAR